MSPLLTLLRQVGLTLLCALQLVHGWARAESLSAQLEQMAEREGFTLIGQEKLPDQPAVKVQGNTTVRLGSMLSGINHVMIKSPSGGIEQLVILSRGTDLPPPQPDQIVVNTRRKGSHHLVAATLTGENGEALQIELLVDTGASYVVLPGSMIPLLGIEEELLDERELQTAKGGVRARIGVLTALTLGHRQIDEVTVAFIADRFLGDNPLLGMSVLGRFRVTLDEAGNRLILVTQDSD